MPTEKEYMLEEATAAVTYQPKLTAGRNINISEDNVISSSGGQGGSVVTVTPNQMSGNLIATVTVDSTSYNLYSPLPQVMTGATSEVRGEQGLVPAPSIGYQDYVLYGDGTWKNPEIPSIIANPSTSAIRDLTKISIDGIVYDISGGGSGSEVVECTQDEYDALPSSKLTDNKIYCISGTKELDSNYNYYKYGENDEIIVRVYHEGQSDENIIWFFNGWNQTVAYETIPSSLASYAPDYDTLILSANYPDGGTVQDGWIGFYQSTIRAWNQGKGENVTGIKYGVVIVTNGAAEQLNPYEDDPYIWISSSIKKIIVNGTEYGNTGGGDNEVIPLTQEEYDDLPPSKLTDNKAYFVKQSKTLDPNYEYHEYEGARGGKIVARVNLTSNEIDWFFVDYTFVGGTVEYLPNTLSAYFPTSTISGEAYDDEGEFVGMAAINNIGGFGLYPRDYSREITGTVRCLLHNVGGTDQVNAYEEPYVWIVNEDYKIIVNGENYLQDSGGTNVEANPEETPTEILHTLGINSTVYSIPGALQPITLTAAQYAALPSTQKMDGSKIYFVTDE